MTRLVRLASRPCAIVCALAVGLSCLPTTVWANEPPSSATSTTERLTPLRVSAERAAALEVHRLQQAKPGPVVRNTEVEAQAQTSGSSELQSGSFFKRPVGIAVLAVFGVGVSYALYSSSNDRIRSSGR